VRPKARSGFDVTLVIRFEHVRCDVRRVVVRVAAYESRTERHRLGARERVR